VILFRVLNGESAVFSLKSAHLRVREAAAATVGRLTLKLLARVKADKLSGQVLKNRTGRLRRSVNAKVDDLGAVVRGQVGTNVAYAAAHEYGFTGEVTVKGHLRTIKQAFGKALKEPVTFAVPAHARHVTLPERSFLRSALADMTDEIRAEFTTAIAAAAKGVA
jgi:phage gpG-like protein